MATRRRSGFGQARKLPSDRWQARYTVPGTTRRVSAPTTFETKGDAEEWLAGVRSDLARGAWLPTENRLTFGDYAETWLQHRAIRPRTVETYRALLNDRILGTFGPMRLAQITPAQVRSWYGRQPPTPTRNARAYGLLRTILTTAVEDSLLVANPCRIRGAGNSRRVSKTEPATLEQVAIIAEEVGETYAPMVLIAAWCALRFGELTELRGKDVNTRAGIIQVRRAVVWVKDLTGVTEPLCPCPPRKATHLIGPPKSEAGIRDVNIPPHLLPTLRAHILRIGAGNDGLLFPAVRGGHMSRGGFQQRYEHAREKAGRADLRFHDLRHTGATMAGATGATLAELMARLGHSTPTAAMRYQHAARGRDAEIAKALSDLAEVRTLRTP